MPRKVVDFSARSKFIQEEPFMLHFWECDPDDYLDYLKDPRSFLSRMGVDLPKDCRIETTIENHDWLGQSTKGLRAANGTIICNVGGGNVARAVYRVVSYAHDHEAVGKFKKRLLHSPEEQESAKFTSS
jgi:hypothetical protein